MSCTKVRIAAIAMLLTFAAAAPASARSFHPISGKLSKSGYTVVALAYNGAATKVNARHGRFAIRPPAARATLQLIGPNGRYAGPVIVGGSRKRVIEGVKAGARLGAIQIRKGYAALKHPLKRKLARKWLDRRRWAQAKRGVPLGNGRNLGLVRSRIHNGPSGIGGDSARTGVPNAFSVDPAGNGKIDVLNPQTSRARSATAHAAADPPASDFPIFSQLLVPFSDSVNADAVNIGAAQIDAGMVRWLSVFMQVLPGDTTQLDCGALSYCASGGTGHLYASPGTGVQPLCSPSSPGCNYNEGPAFPAPGDSLGVLPQSANSTPAGAFALLPEAPSSKIGSGDVLVQRVTSGGSVTSVPGTVKFVFTSEPALQSWSSGSDSATVTYPVTANAPGTTSNPWQIGGGAGDTVLEFTFWRPQRAGITGAGEAPSMDIGHLHYISRPAVRTPGGSVLRCPQSSYSTTDPNMAVGSDGQEAFVADQSNDAPSNPANTLSYSLDLTNCAAANGQTLTSGEELDVDVSGRSPASGDNTGTNYTFRIR